jgi:uncharacterized protein with von Willebrand factor type A (vWA) domain
MGLPDTALEMALGYLSKHGLLIRKRLLRRKVKPSVFVVTDGGYQALFAATGKGVALFDAPPSRASPKP